MLIVAMKKLSLLITLCVALLFIDGNVLAQSAGTVPITVKNAEPGAPVKLGIPFPEGELHSPDHVRVLNGARDEIASQTTLVSTWEPADVSVKWLWVFFFADGSEEYIIEYGKDVKKQVSPESPIVFKNNQRSNGYAEITTGPLRFRIGKGGSGFIDRIEFNPAADGFSEDDVIARGLERRGSFLDFVNDSVSTLDVMNEAGIDTSGAVITQQFIERGSGPLHAILRVEGEYEYERDELENSPFVTYIHAYAGKSYVKVLHTITYTGNPDRSEPLGQKEHADIATQIEFIVDEKERSKDEGLTIPADKISATGLGLSFDIENPNRVSTALLTGEWWETGAPEIVEFDVSDQSDVSVLQTGPNPTRVPPVANSTVDARIDGFKATISTGEILRESEKAEGWMAVSNDKWGVAVGIKNMVEEYPKELAVDLENGQFHAYAWSPNAAPMSFERADTEEDGGMVGNFARGLTKTTESVLYFFDGGESTEEIRNNLQFVLNPPVAHANADWYSNSGVYGAFASAENEFEGLERSMQYKFDWMLFNRDWEPWYGAFEYGDLKNYYFRENWYQWANNEPAIDYMWWMNFMRTGDPEMYSMAQASSRHSMDVDNVHWPTSPEYRGDTNSSLDYLLLAEEPQGTPYLGMGRRHAGQQHISMLSAHVWIPGWIASYYLDGYHRGLEVAKLTGDYYIRRIFQEHGLTGRRLYLSIWNLSELYDATKDPKYLAELNDRVERVLQLQRDQGGRMIIDRYGYSQVYLSQGFKKYLQMFDAPEIENALVQHARSIHDVPPLDHDMESYLSSISMLIAGYDLSGDDKFLIEACNRSQYLVADPMSGAMDDIANQALIVEELKEISHLPMGGEGPSFRGRSPIWSLFHGLRIFGWTHAYNVPYIIDRLENRDDLSGMPCAE